MRYFCLLLALITTFLGLKFAQAEASAPEFPSCITTKIDANTSRYWLDPGDLVSRLRSVSVQGQDMRRRKDGIWVGGAPASATRPDVYFAYNRTTVKGAWVPCRKPTP